MEKQNGLLTVQRQVCCFKYTEISIGSLWPAAENHGSFTYKVLRPKLWPSTNGAISKLCIAPGIARSHRDHRSCDVHSQDIDAGFGAMFLKWCLVLCQWVITPSHQYIYRSSRWKTVVEFGTWTAFAVYPHIDKLSPTESTWPSVKLNHKLAEDSGKPEFICNTIFHYPLAQ